MYSLYIERFILRKWLILLWRLVAFKTDALGLQTRDSGEVVAQVHSQSGEIILSCSGKVSLCSTKAFN